jgi:hypothetical protein
MRNVGAGMGRARLWARSCLVGAAALTLGLGGPVTAAHAAGGAAIAVSPNTGLVSGQTLTVAGSRFAPREDIGGVECLVGAADPLDCDLSTLVFLESGPRGGFKTPFVAHRTLLLTNGFVDCAVSSCEVLFASAADFTEQATAPISFDPNIPLPPTSVRVNPSTNLVDQQVVSVHGVGFLAHAHRSVGIAECVTATFACSAESGVPVGPAGRASIDMSVRRILTDIDGSRIDCATAPGTCEIVVLDPADIDYHATALLKFNPKLAPPPPPTLRIVPNHKLPFYARVSMTGAHWEPNDFIDLVECSASNFESCADIGLALVDSQGNLAAAPMLQRDLVDIFNPTNPPIDCARRAANCVVIAQSFAGDTATTAVLFDRNAPIPPPPSANIVPAGPYRNNQVVQVNGLNFAPKAEFSVAECAAGASEIACFGTGGPQVTTAKGHLSTSFQVERRMDDGMGSTIDCRTSGVSCTLEIASEGGANVEVPLTFRAPAAGDTARAVTADTVTSAPGWANPERSTCAGVGTQRSLAHIVALSERGHRACAALHHEAVAGS